MSTSEVFHFDEIGIRVAKLLHWFHLASADTIICYLINLRPGTSMMNNIGILEGFEGYTVHDRYSSYNQFDLYHAA